MQSAAHIGLPTFGPRRASRVEGDESGMRSGESAPLREMPKLVGLSERWGDSATGLAPSGPQ
jgi:hypothetical protein